MSTEIKRTIRDVDAFLPIRVWQSYHFWKNHLAKLTLTSQEEEIMREMVGNRDRFGFEFGDIRPGTLGRWDVFSTLMADYGFSALNKADRALYISGLDPATAERYKLGESMTAAGFDPEDPQEVALYNWIKGLSEEELAQEVKRLEQSSGEQAAGEQPAGESLDKRVLWITLSVILMIL